MKIMERHNWQKVALPGCCQVVAISTRNFSYSKVWLEWPAHGMVNCAFRWVIAMPLRWNLTGGPDNDLQLSLLIFWGSLIPRHFVILARELPLTISIDSCKKFLTQPFGFFQNGKRSGKLKTNPCQKTENLWTKSSTEIDWQNLMGLMLQFRNKAGGTGVWTEHDHATRCTASGVKPLQTR